MGSLALGLPLVATEGSRAAFAQNPNTDSTARVMAELERQLVDSIRSMWDRPGEGSRRAAAVYRLAAAMHGDGRLDAIVKRNLRAHIDRMGRLAVLTKENDPVRVMRELRRFGVATPYVPRPINFPAREAALDLVLRQGATGVLTQMATVLETYADGVERLRVVARLQDAGTCAILEDQQDAAEEWMGFFCGWGAILPQYFMMGCAFWTGYFTGILIQTKLRGC